MKKIMLLPLFLLPVMAISATADEENPYSKDTIETCPGKPMSGEVNACMIYMNEKEKASYERAFLLFEKKIIAGKDDLNDYDNFRSSISQAKFYWDKYIEEECQSSAHLNFNDSYAYYTDYNLCLAKAYKERALFYKDYKF